MRLSPAQPAAFLEGLGPSRPAAAPASLHQHEEGSLERFLGMLSPYDNYPPFTSGYLHVGIGEQWPRERILDAWREGLARRKEGRGSPYLGLYIHWPFCVSLCRFCFCQKTLPEGPRQAEEFLAWLKDEMRSYAEVFKGACFDSVYFGGGTPSFIAEPQLEEMLAEIRRLFRIQPGAHINFEAAPSSMSRRKLAIMDRFGVNRISMGLQSLDPDVLLKVDRRGQTREVVERCVRWVREFPKMLLNVDLMCGLPGQSGKSFLQDVAAVSRWKTDMVHFFQFDPRPDTRFSREGRVLDDPERMRARQMLMAGVQLIKKLGYRSPWRNEAKRIDKRFESWQHVATRWYNGSLLSFGSGVFSHVYGQCWYTQDSKMGAQGRGSPRNRFQAISFDEEEEMRGYCLHHLETRRRLYRARFRGFFGKDPLEVQALAPIFADLAREGLIKINKRWIDYPYHGMHPGVRVTATKRFYSRSMVESVIKAHAPEHERFLERYAALGPEGMDQELALNARDSYMSRRFLLVEKTGAQEARG